MQVTIKDTGNLTAPSNLTVTVNASLSAIVVNPPTAGVPVNGTQALLAWDATAFIVAAAPGGTSKAKHREGEPGVKKD